MRVPHSWPIDLLRESRPEASPPSRSWPRQVAGSLCSPDCVRRGPPGHRRLGRDADRRHGRQTTAPGVQGSRTNVTPRRWDHRATCAGRKRSSRPRHGAELRGALGAIAANAPYAPSTCSHNPSARVSSRSSGMGSTAPVPMVPAVAITPIGLSPAARSAAIISRTASSPHPLGIVGGN